MTQLDSYRSAGCHRQTSNSRRRKLQRGIPLFVFIMLLPWLPAQSAPNIQSPVPSLNEMNWLAGHWSGEFKGGTATEHWAAPAGGHMLGTACTTGPDGSAFYEFMHLHRPGGILTLTVHPRGGPGVSFKLASSQPGEAVFENPVHDFPQRIIYRRQGNLLLARIEGKEGGEMKSEEFKYQMITAQPAPLEGIKAILRQVEIPAAREDVWAAWTTPEGIKTFLAPEGRLSLVPGGPFEIYFAPEAPAGSRGSEGCKILSYLPQRMLSFDWNAPPSLPDIRQQRTWVVLTFEATGPQQTKLELFHLGWQEGPGWDQAYAYFEKAWSLVLARLQHRFIHGPLDWKNPYRPPVENN